MRQWVQRTAEAEESCRYCPSDAPTTGWARTVQGGKSLLRAGLPSARSGCRAGQPGGALDKLVLVDEAVVVEVHGLQ